MESQQSRTRMDERIRMVEVRELSQNFVDDWERKLAQRIKSRVQQYARQVINVESLDGLLDLEGEKIDVGYFEKYLGHKYKYISIRNVSMTNSRKKLLKERYLKNEEKVHKELDSIDTTLYFRRAGQNEFRVGVYYTRLKNMGIFSSVFVTVKTSQDLLTIHVCSSKYK